jgi:small conductance mechanosensitive channel
MLIVSPKANVGIDLSNAWRSGARIGNDTISLLPNLILAVIIFVLFFILAKASRSIVRSIVKKRGRRPTLGILLGQLAQLTILIVGLLITISVIAPSFQAVDLIKMLGIGSVAIGFAFQNILQNFLAGVLLLIHEPFKLGDTISVTGIEGVVDDIQTRATIISTVDGHRVFIPNATLFTNPVSVTNQVSKHDAAASASAETIPPAAAVATGKSNSQ